MKIEIVKKNEVIIFNIDGNMIGSNNNILNDELTKIIDQKGIKLIINMRNTPQLDSYALGVLASSGSEIQKNGGNMIFAELKPFVATLFNMMRMNDIFKIFDTLDEAIKFYD